MLMLIDNLWGSNHLPPLRGVLLLKKEERLRGSATNQRSNQRPISGIYTLTRHPSGDTLSPPTGGAREIRYSPQRILKPFVIMHGQLGFDFLDNFNDDRDNNQQTGAAECQRCSPGVMLEQKRQNGNDRQKERAG